MIAAGLLVGCGTSHRATLRISGEGGIGPVLSRADLRSVRAGVDPRNSQPDSDILLELTPNGQRKLVGLTTNVAGAGRRRHRPVYILISVNGRVISKRYIGYHVPRTSSGSQPKGSWSMSAPSVQHTISRQG